MIQKEPRLLCFAKTTSTWILAVNPKQSLFVHDQCSGASKFNKFVKASPLNNFNPTIQSI